MAVFLAFLYQVAVTVKGKPCRRRPACAEMLGIVAGKAEGFQVVRVQAYFGVAYIGGGQVVEAMGTKYGVVKTELAGRGWTHWLKIPYINYD